jgi:hypothetical protein
MNISPAESARLGHSLVGEQRGCLASESKRLQIQVEIHHTRRDAFKESHSKPRSFHSLRSLAEARRCQFITVIVSNEEQHH